MFNTLVDVISNPEKLSGVYTLIKIVVIETVVLIGFLLFVWEYLKSYFN